MKHRGVKTAEHLIQQTGLQVVSMKHTGSGHLKVRVRAPDGREENQMFPMSTSDSHRGHLNKLAELKRFASGHSIIIERTHT